MEKLILPPAEELNIINKTLEEEAPFEGFADAWGKERKNLEDLATKDPLTSLYNRRGFMEEARRLASRIRPEGKAPHRKEELTNLSFMLVDVDNFKRINDTFGHDVGDIALKAVAQTLRGLCREEDIVGRWGGEEFIVAFPHSNLVEVLRKFGFDESGKKTAQLPKTDIALSEKDNEQISITLSAGVAEYRPDQTQMQNIENAIKRADEALHQAKESGKNRLLSE